MSKNYMEKVAKMLGLELEESFRIDGEYGYFMLTETGLWRKTNLEDEYWRRPPYDILHNLLIAVYEIIKLPRKPAIGDMYCYPDPVTPLLWGTCSWRDDVFDNYRFQHGLIFATREEAIEIAKQMQAVTKQEGKNNG